MITFSLLAILALFLSLNLGILLVLILASFLTFRTSSLSVGYERVGIGALSATGVGAIVGVEIGETGRVGESGVDGVGVEGSGREYTEGFKKWSSSGTGIGFLIGVAPVGRSS